MNRSLKRPALWVSAILVILTLLEGANYWFGFRRAADMDSGTSGEKTVLYWYDPMVPDKHFEKSGKSPFMDMQLVPKYAQTTAAAKAEPMYWYDPMIPDKHFDKPGKSPFMDMQLVPKYPDGAGDDGGSIRISPATLQNLGVRTSQVESGTLSAAAHVPGSVAWDQRSAFEINARVDGVVDILGIRAPYETARKGQALAELIAPEWSAAAQEYLELGRAESADARALRSAARHRLLVLGMDEGQIRHLRGGNPRVVVRAPADGVVSSLQVRQGQRVQAGMPLMTIHGLDTVWVEAAIPQAQAAGIVPGTEVIAEVSAFPGESFRGSVESLLPDLDAGTRTQMARIVLDNPGHRLAPGMFADLQFASDTRDSHLLIPDGALIATGTDARVIVVVDDGTFRPVRVIAGHSAAGKTEILKGLNVGDRVVVSGQFLIDSEASLSGALDRLSTPDGDMGGSGNADDGGMPGMDMPAPQQPPAMDADMRNDADAMKDMAADRNMPGTSQSQEHPR